MNWRDMRELVLSMLSAVLVFMLVQSAFQTSMVDGPSMEPLLHTGERLIIDKAAYWAVDPHTMFWLPPSVEKTTHGHLVEVFAGPQRGDLIVFHPPTVPDDLYIKRVIGLPGETVQVTHGQVYINNVPLDEPYLSKQPSYDYGPEVVPSGAYFVLGDNRNHSSDSSKWGMLPRENVVGRAEVRVWPFDLTQAGLGKLRPVLAQK